MHEQGRNGRALRLKKFRHIPRSGGERSRTQGPLTWNERYDQLQDAKDVVLATVRAIVIRRALQSEMRKSRPPLGFWVVVNNALFDSVVLGWAKLFGSDHGERQQIHWKNVFADHAGFRQRLLIHLGVSKKELGNYWKEMKSYRDKAVAHHDSERWRTHTTHPVFEIALKSAAFYYQEIVAAFNVELGQSWEPRNLGDYLVSYQMHSELVSESAVPPTLDITECFDTSDDLEDRATLSVSR